MCVTGVLLTTIGKSGKTFASTDEIGINTRFLGCRLTCKNTQCDSISYKRGPEQAMRDTAVKEMQGRKEESKQEIGNTLKGGTRHHLVHAEQQTAASKQQTADSRQQTADSRQQTADRRQKTEDRQYKASPGPR